MNRQKRHKQKQRTKRKEEKKERIAEQERRVTLAQVEADYRAALGEEDSQPRTAATRG